MQDALVQATYWHDPLDEEAYINKSIFLADINNEIRVNKTYVENLNNLEHLVLVKFDNDTIVQPRETEWFGFYEPGQAKKVVPLNMTRLYLEVCWLSLFIFAAIEKIETYSIVSFLLFFELWERSMWEITLNYLFCSNNLEVNNEILHVTRSQSPSGCESKRVLQNVILAV